MKIKKSLFFITSLMLVLFSSCKIGNLSSSNGLADQAFVYFVSDNKYREPITVEIDGDVLFKAHVIKEKKSTIKRHSYAIATGKHFIKVTYKGRVLYQKNIFVSTQESKRIILP